MPSVLDASAMLALARSEPGADLVLAALSTSENPCLAHYVNLCEVFYTTARREGEDEAGELIQLLTGTLGVVPYQNPEAEFYWEVGRLRALATSERLALSLADCFCIATARALSGELLTCDHAEFDPVVGLGLCTVTFIR
jgi:PIN domain nuclease of toxin-antitoxin system